MRRCGAVLAVGLLLALLATTQVRATLVSLEVNGRDYYGTVLSEHGETYAALDVLGPLLLGPEFRLETFEYTNRRCIFRFIPVGTAVTQRMELFGCTKRGSAVYAPIRQLVRQVGGSYEESADLVRIAYPPVAPSLPAAEGVKGATPRPQATPAPQAAPSVQPHASPSPLAVTVSPSPMPMGSVAPGGEGAPASPAPADTVEASPAPSALSRDVALTQVERLNSGAYRGASAVMRLEVYHPVSPDPSDVIARTDLAGLRIRLRRLVASDQLMVSLWNGLEPQGPPVFSTRLTRYGAHELRARTVFVRLPLTVDAGWHTVRVVLNGRETVDYRFATW